MPVYYQRYRYRHDLRTPLNGVLAFTSFALRENDSAKKQEYLEKIQLSGRLLMDLVDDTLELSRIESGKMALEAEATDTASIGMSLDIFHRLPVRERRHRISSVLLCMLRAVSEQAHNQVFQVQERK